MKLRMTIGNKIQLCVIIMILLSVGLVVGTTFPKFEKTMADATKNQLMDQVTAEAATVDGIVKEYRNALDSLAEDQDIVAFAEGGLSVSYWKKMQELCESEGYIEEIAVLDDEGALRYTTDTESETS